MGVMDNEKKLNATLERFYHRFNSFNSDVLKQLGEVIKQFEGLTPSEAHKLAQELRYSTKINKIFKELSRISGKSIKELNQILDEVAKENVGFSEVYYEYKNKKFIPYEDNEPLQRYVNTIKKETKNTFKNLSGTTNIGFTLKDEQGNLIYKPLKKVFNELIDQAVFYSSQGVQDYQSGMRNIIRGLADSGVKIHEEKVGYKSGYNRRIDTTVRQTVLTGIRKINIGIQERIGEELGTDGVEISAHFPCAEDHLPYQGRQFTNKRFKKINTEELTRPIGDRGYNCGHFIFSIIMGVNEPSYADSELKKLNTASNRKIKYGNKTYTAYEASQIQRQLETEIRKQKDRQIIARASNSESEIMKAQKKITQLTNKYYDFSKKAKLEIYKERLSVTGYHRLTSYDEK